MDNNLPIACLLTDSELDERRREVLQKIRGAVKEIQEIDDGFRYRFLPDDARLVELARLVEFEHKCCPFLTFRIIVEPGDGPIWLELSGPVGTKEFLADLFN